jgi:transposase
MNVAELEPEVQDYIREIERGAVTRIAALEAQNQQLIEELKLIRFKHFGRSSEKVDLNTPLLFDEAESRREKNEPPEDTIAVPAHKRLKPGRKPLDPNLPRVDIVHDIPDADKQCACGRDVVKIGEEVHERLQTIQRQFWVERHIRPYYGCKHCEGSGDEDKRAIRIAESEPSIIPRGIATPGLLSSILINKFCDALPFYRQEQRFARMGIDISRQDMSNWTIAVAKAALPVMKILEAELLRSPLIQMDETPVQVLGQIDRPNTAKSYMWLARGGPPGQQVVLYRYRPTHDASHPQKMLATYQGYLQTDGYEAYKKAIEGQDIILVGCWAHARRRFFEASKAGTIVGSAHEGLNWIRKLYAIERDLRDQLKRQNAPLTPESFLEKRRAAVEPVLSDFRAWLEQQVIRIAPSSLCGQAIAYTLGQWDKLVRYLDLVELTPDNNAAENAIRPFVMGRKNWLFSGSPEGAEASCVIYSLIETAKANGLNPTANLFYLCDRLPHARTDGDYRQLLPWKQADSIPISTPLPPGLF